MTIDAPDGTDLIARLAAGELPDERGRFGPFGGRYVPEILVAALDRLTEEAQKAFADPEFNAELQTVLATVVGRPTPLCEAPRLGEKYGVQLLFKREDLAHTGAHKINNALGQALLAKRMGAKRVIAETGAGQHGVASAAACARVGLDCTVYMGAKDCARQAPNVARMKLLGAKVAPVESGDATLRSAIDEALRDWVSDPEGTYYLLGSAVGPHPYPFLVRELQSVIGREARRQCLDAYGKLPDVAVACVGGGSNAIGLFAPFVGDTQVDLLGVEAGGDGQQHGASITYGSPGVLHGSYGPLLQDRHGQIADTHSISAGLDYPGIGPEHALLAATKRARYTAVTDDQAVAALRECSSMEGILPALETAHALAAVPQLGRDRPGALVLIGLSGRGDKDLDTLCKILEEETNP
ncbi:MAG: tryptophan synthase subunit beta [Myxococcota bacterium]